MSLLFANIRKALKGRSLLAPSWDFEDDFNRSDGSLSDSADWEDLAGAAVVAIVSNEIRRSGTTAAALLATSYGPDVEGEFTIGASVSGLREEGALVRYDPATYNGWVIDSASTLVQIIRGDSGVPTTVASYSTSPVAGDVISYSVIGDSFEVFLNGTSILTTTSATYNTQTRVGVYLVSASGTAALDDFKIRNVT